MILYLLAGAALALCIATIRDEFRPGGVLDWRGTALSYDDGLEKLLEAPLPEGWDQHDVLLTYAEIRSL